MTNEPWKAENDEMKQAEIELFADLETGRQWKPGGCEFTEQLTHPLDA